MKKAKTKAEGTPDTGQLSGTILLLNSTHDYEISNACVALYQFAEKSEENKLVLSNTENCLKKLLEHLHNECLSVRRFSCMVLASLSLNASVRKEIRKSKGLLERLLCFIKCDDDNVLKENTLLLLSSLANEFSWKVSICDKGGLVLLLDCLQSEDPDIIKNALQTLALVLQYFNAKTALYSCNNIQYMFGLMFSEHIIIKQLVITVFIQAVEYAPMRIMMGMRGIMEMIFGCLACNPDGESLPHVLHLLSKCLCIPNMLEEFCSVCGTESLLCLLRPNIRNKEEPTDEKKPDKKIPPSKTKKEKEHETEAKILKHEFSLIRVQDLTDSVFECLQRIAMQPKFYRALQRDNIDDLLLSLLPNVETSGKNLTSFLNLLGVLCYYIKSRLYFGERTEILFKLISSVIPSNDPDLLKAISFFMTNLSYDCQKCCRLMAIYDAAPIVNNLLQSSSEEVLLDTCSLICNLSSCFESRSNVISNDVVTLLVRLLKSQLLPCNAPLLAPDLQSNLEPQNGEDTNNQNPNNQDPNNQNPNNQDPSNQNNTFDGPPFQESAALIEKILLALACLSLDQSVRNRILETDAVKDVISLMNFSHLKVQKAASVLILKLADNEETAEKIYNLCGLHILYEIQKSRSRSNEFSERALDRMYNFKLVEKFTFQGFLSYEDEIKDGFYDIGQINCQKVPLSVVKPIENYLNERTNNRWRPVFVVNATPTKNVIDKSVENAEKTSVTSKPSLNGGQKNITNKKKRPAKKSDASVLQNGKTSLASEVEVQPKLPNIPEDPELFDLIERCRNEIVGLPTTKHQVIALARLVSETMGGQIVKQYLDGFEWENHLKDLMQQSNLVPLGKVKWGIHFHRALLFKVLADRIKVPCCLRRMEFNRGFVEVTLMEEAILFSPDTQRQIEQLVPERFIVDVVFQPGRLIPVESCEAKSYTSL